MYMYVGRWLESISVSSDDFWRSGVTGEYWKLKVENIIFFVLRKGHSKPRIKKEGNFATCITRVYLNSNCF